MNNEAYWFFRSQREPALRAFRLAQAEAWAKTEEASIEWIPDDDASAVLFDADHVYGCIVTVAGIQSSLWGIGDPSQEYQRVVQAELCLECMHDFFDLKNHQVLSL